MVDILMPRAVAVWLVANTALTFKQIADFCGLHPLEVKGIADGDVASNMYGRDPIMSGDLSREEIEKAQKDPNYHLQRLTPKHKHLYQHKRKGPRYTPLSKRQDKPNAIAWLLHHHPELSDSQIIKLIGTTKTTIESIRTRSHWNTANIRLSDPVILGLCQQIELDDMIGKAQKKQSDKDTKDASSITEQDTKQS